MCVNANFDRSIHKNNITPVEKPQVQPKPEEANTAPAQSPPVQTDDSELKDLAQGSALTCFDLGLDDEDELPGGDGDKTARQFGYDSARSLQAAVGATVDGVVGHDTLVKLKEHLGKERAELEKNLGKEIPAQLGVDSMSDAQNKLGIMADGKVGPETLKKLDSMLDSGDLILSTVNTMLQAQEFKAMIKVLEVNLQMTDEVLKLLDNRNPL
jgi:hypothetical protein